MVQLSEIARILNVPIDAPDRAIARVAAIEDAGPDDLTYATGSKYAAALAASRAGVAIVPLKLAIESSATLIRVADPELAIAAVLAAFAPAPSRPAPGVHPTAVVEASASLATDVAIGPNVYVGDHAHVGPGTVLHANVVIAAHARVGAGCELHPTVVVGERCTLGDRVLCHAGVVIGADGFGFRWDGKRHVKVPQVGIVVIGDDVEIGANSCVDRAKFGQTRIGTGTKIDNLVQVGHNCVTGAHCILCGQVALAGSTTLGNGVVMGGSSASAGHLTMGHGSVLAARGAVMSDVAPKQVMAGVPARPHRDWLKNEAAINALPELIKRVRALEAEVAALRANA